MFKKTVLALALAATTISTIAEAGLRDSKNRVNSRDLLQLEEALDITLGVCSGTILTWGIGNLSCGPALINTANKGRFKRIFQTIDKAKGRDKDYTRDLFRSQGGISISLFIIPGTAPAFNGSAILSVETFRKELRELLHYSMKGNKFNCFNPDKIKLQREVNKYTREVDSNGVLCRKKGK